MQSLVRVLISNIHTVCFLTTHTTHKLRVVHADSPLPSLQHEMRYIAPLARLFTADSRQTIVKVLLQTLNVIQNLRAIQAPFVDPIRAMIIESQNTFVEGCQILRQTYENDVSTSINIDRIVQVWESFYIVDQRPIVVMSL